MVRHIVMWDLKKDIQEETRQKYAVQIKQELEALRMTVPGIIALTVVITPLPASNADLMLNSVFENEQSLANYQLHPAHKKTASLIGSVTCNRRCMDYQE